MRIRIVEETYMKVDDPRREAQLQASKRLQSARRALLLAEEEFSRAAAEYAAAANNR